ncbi:MAG: ABC transporter substrate-binding protein [Thermoflexales bacterium]|nr:ABC transporter substrate-binding protein [Thermoflexales bacterium]
MQKPFAILLAATLTLSACVAPGVPAGPTVVRLPMGYIPNAQYAPFYVAVEKGYFAAEGIQIDFDYKFETDGVKLVGANALPFAVVSGEQVVLARAQGLPVKYVAQWYHTFPVAVFSLASSGIRTPADLKGKRIGLAGFFGATYVGWRAFLAANGLSEADVKQEAIGFTQREAVQQGKVDAAVGYVNNEPVALAESGFPVTVFVVGEKVNLVANGLLTNEETIRTKPALVRGMNKALLRGVADTIKDPDAALAVATKYVEGLKVDDPVQRKVMLATVEMMKTSGKQGASSVAAWEATQATLLAMGQIQKPLEAGAYFTNEFLP